jgi:hypothetical protein
VRPGDLLLTGSPAGNGASHGVFLHPGDVMEGTITGLGTQRNRCVAEQPAVVPAYAAADTAIERTSVNSSSPQGPSSRP